MKFNTRQHKLKEKNPSRPRTQTESKAQKTKKKQQRKSRMQSNLQQQIPRQHISKTQKSDSNPGGGKCLGKAQGKKKTTNRLLTWEKVLTN
ncbi:hypothetical protein HYD67_00670 [Mycoplasmopsis bovis]|nr:hypothetical protein [Mycoplasmopsis bovis]QQH54793.1 hypothetical protein HYD67_00670 [Mycoplasmopsis bovis]